MARGAVAGWHHSPPAVWRTAGRGGQRPHRRSLSVGSRDINLPSPSTIFHFFRVFGPAGHRNIVDFRPAPKYRKTRNVAERWQVKEVRETHHAIGHGTKLEAHFLGTARMKTLRVTHRVLRMPCLSDSMVMSLGPGPGTPQVGPRGALI